MQYWYSSVVTVLVSIHRFRWRSVSSLCVWAGETAIIFRKERIGGWCGLAIRGVGGVVMRRMGWAGWYSRGDWLPPGCLSLILPV